jgi:hypothetical protein
MIAVGAEVYATQRCIRFEFFSTSYLLYFKKRNHSTCKVYRDHPANNRQREQITDPSLMTVHSVRFHAQIILVSGIIHINHQYKLNFAQKETSLCRPIL